ncbi:Cdc6/Cdc18 family protein [Halocatena pleomorpha]|uniref:ORC1-type DNA replication protein n=1 Tax=Halocatena pleomorpha TaxID=1785090 RepID=A0A3P3R9I5_9EURY|nr:AAA family ATPase [Halocatena pleomorpha]RRJ29985.1 cell division control protein Cdc6 [Halocatena pleomorpha]
MSDGTSTSDESRDQDFRASDGQNTQFRGQTSEPKGSLDETEKSQSSDENGQQFEVDDPLFSQRTGIFRNKEMVRVGWVPDGNRIVGRDDYISTISSCLNDAVYGGAPNHISITGKTGTGKSLVSRYITRRAVNASVDDVRMGHTYLDCSKSSTEVQVISTIGQQLNDESIYDEAEDIVKMPDTGLPTDKFYKRLWQILAHYDSVIIILDEVDLLRSDHVLMSLAKAVESNDTSCQIGIIAISNQINYFDELNPRTKSAFQAVELNFDPYNATQIQDILRGREDAFRDGVLTDDVIPLVAAFSAQEHGDARKAMRLFRTAGELADREGSGVVEEHHVRRSQDTLEKDRFRDFLQGTPTQMKAACLSIAAKSLYSRDDYIITGELYDAYQQITNAVDMDTIGIRRFRDILDEMQLSQVIETKEVNMGKGGGRHNSHRLLHNPEVILDIVVEDTRFRAISKASLKRFA